MTYQEDLSDVVLKLLEGAVPERFKEFVELWKRYAPDVKLDKDGQGINMNANKHRIQFDAKSLDVMWLIGFNGWRSIETYYPSIFWANITSSKLDSVLKQDEELGAFEMDYKGRMDSARKIITASKTSSVQWPPDIPQPQSDRDNLSSTQEKAAFDLVLMAVAFAFLHEFRHVMFDADGDAPPEGPEEEIACDVWARAFLTEKLHEYVKTTEHKHKEVLTKRAMAMALGAIILREITPEYARWGTAEYPPIVYRINSLIGGTQLPDDSYFWLVSACLMVGVIRQMHLPLDIVPTSNRMLTEDLISMLH